MDSNPLSLIIQLITVVTAAGGAVAVVATLRQQAKNAEDRHTELKAGQNEIWRSIADHRDRGASLAAVVEGLRHDVTAFSKLEDERHEKTDIALDEIKGDMRRQNGDIIKLGSEIGRAFLKRAPAAE